MHTETDKSQLNVWAALACLASTNGTETDNGHREAMQPHTHREKKTMNKSFKLHHFDAVLGKTASF